ncbi:MAG TPA: S9 family peptidase, partial [Myxococcota bacterium]|nr:S9 family peptidase [Myxococcota bacterium]
MKPPRPPARPTLLPSPFGDRTDPYYWLRDDSRQSAELLEHLAAENAYYKAVMAPHQELEDQIYTEILGRIQQDDDSVPWRYRGWWYWSRYEKGKEHPIYYRRRDQDGSPEELLLDMNQRAEGQSYCTLGGWAPSPNGQRLVFLEDTVGRRQHVLWVKDLNTGKILEDQIPGCSGSVAWLDDQTLLYVRNDPETLRPFEVLLHRLGTDPKEDRLLHREEDEAYYVGVGTTADETHALIHLGSTVTSEVLVAPLGPDPVFQPFWPRERDHEYHLDHLDGHWIIRSNKGSLNFRILRQADGAEQPEEWVAHRDDVFLEQITPLRDWLVIGERADALRRIRLLRWDRSEDRILASDEAAYSAWI